MFTCVGHAQVHQFVNFWAPHTAREGQSARFWPLGLGVLRCSPLMMETGLAANHFSTGLAYVQQAEPCSKMSNKPSFPETCSSKMRILTVNFLLHSLGGSPMSSAWLSRSIPSWRPVFEMPCRDMEQSHEPDQPRCFQTRVGLCIGKGPERRLCLDGFSGIVSVCNHR